jgi:hypothetical protein
MLVHAMPCRNILAAAAKRGLGGCGHPSLRTPPLLALPRPPYAIGYTCASRAGISLAGRSSTALATTRRGLVLQSPARPLDAAPPHACWPRRPPRARSASSLSFPRAVREDGAAADGCGIRVSAHVSFAGCTCASRAGISESMFAGPAEPAARTCGADVTSRDAPRHAAGSMIRRDGAVLRPLCAARRVCAAPSSRGAGRAGSHAIQPLSQPLLRPRPRLLMDRLEQPGPRARHRLESG